MKIRLAENGEEMSRSKLFWLKMPKDFFKRHDIRIIEDSDCGKEMLLFYIKLLCESLDHEGRLRFSDKTPYNCKMLSTITNTSLDVVEQAIDLLKELGLVEVLEDKTLYMSKVPEMTGSETSRAQYMRDYREKNRDESEYGEFRNVLLTDKEYEVLGKRYPNDFEEYIEKLSTYKKSKGVEYASDYATLLKWLKKDYGEPFV